MKNESDFSRKQEALLSILRAAYANGKSFSDEDILILSQKIEIDIMQIKEVLNFYPDFCRQKAFDFDDELYPEISGVIAEKDIAFDNLDGKSNVNFKFENDWLKECLNKDFNEILQVIEKSGLKCNDNSLQISDKIKTVIGQESDVKYLIINAAQMALFANKDRVLLKNETYKLLTGIIILANLIKTNTCYIYVKPKYQDEIKILQKVINEFAGAKLLSNLKIIIFEGGSSYICGVDTALIKSIEGKPAYPEVTPPYVMQKGLWGKPTLVLGTENTALIPVILKKGAMWFIKNQPKLFTISGDVVKPCVVEANVGVSLIKLVEYAHGIKDNFKAGDTFLIGGLKNGRIILRDEAENVNLTEDIAGTGSVVVTDSLEKMRDLLQKILIFYQNETCGQCLFCRQVLNLTKNNNNNLQILEDYINNMEHNAICPFFESVCSVIKGILDYDKNFN